MQDTAELIPINVIVSGRSYRIRVARNEEAFVRKAVKRVNEQIADLRQTYAGKDEQDFVAMCLLMCATQKSTDAVNNMLEDELKMLSDKIDKVLDLTRD